MQDGVGDSAAAWREIRADPDIQYAPVALPDAPTTPDWLTRLFDFIADLLSPVAGLLVANWGLIWPLLAGAAGLLALYVLARLLAPGLLHRRGARASGGEEAPDMTPQRAAALALLEEADCLAAAGRYDEATHLLLTRSVGQIAALRPDLVEPSSTAREIAATPQLPPAGRQAFSTIAARVEQSLFALRRLSAEDWQVARAAYAEFASLTDRELAA